MKQAQRQKDCGEAAQQERGAVVPPKATAQGLLSPRMSPDERQVGLGPKNTQSLGDQGCFRLLLFGKKVWGVGGRPTGRER